MGDTTVMKVDSGYSPTGHMGQKYLAISKNIAMRLWENEPPGDPKPETERDYETVGYVISGRAELHIEGQMVKLHPGDSWSVPRGAQHTYRILETFTAVEATHPPAVVHGRDELTGGYHGHAPDQSPHRRSGGLRMVLGLAAGLALAAAVRQFVQGNDE